MVMREELRSVSREGGAQCVIHHGIMWMLKWCADNLVLVQQVYINIIHFNFNMIIVYRGYCTTRVVLWSWKRARIFRWNQLLW